MTASGRVNFGTMDAVVFGKPAAEAVAEEARRLGARHVFLMVSSSLNRNTDEIAKVTAALGNRCSAVFDWMPPHTPRSAVIDGDGTGAGRKADLIVTIGGGSITDGAKAVQLCLANNIRTADAMDALRPVKGADGTSRRRHEGADCAPDHACRRRSPAASSAPSRASPTSARR